MSNLQPDIGKSLLRQLSGFRGYPKAIRLADGNLDSTGEARFVDCLCEISLSVEHAIAIVDSFDGEFPTIREMRDTALNLRPKFEAKVDERKKWEAKYGKPKPEWSVKFTARATADVGIVDAIVRKKQHAEESRALLWQAIRDSIYYTETSMGRTDLASIEDKDDRIHAFKFWRQAAQRNQRNHPAECAAFRVELATGGWDKLMDYDWANGTFPPVARQAASGAVAVLERPITQADIDAELRNKKREPGDEE